MIQEYRPKYLCLDCKAVLPDFNGVNRLDCDTCGASYPVLGGLVPVLIPNPHRRLASFYIALQNARQSILEKIESLRQAALRSKEQTERMIDALVGQDKIFRSVGRLVTEHLNLAEVALAHRAGEVGFQYEFRLNYLRKDWNPGQYEQEEREIIKNALFNAKKPYPNRQHALVLGAGMGWIAQELLLRFSKVTTLDDSVFMAGLLVRLIWEDFTIHDLKTKSVQAAEDQVVKGMAKMSRSQRKAYNGSPAKVTHLVGDARNMPLEPGSVSALFSIYFTDVLPLSQWLPAALDLLAPGGEFIHYGPLEYHFTSEAERLSLEELKQYLAGLGMSLVAESAHPGSHCRYEGTESYRVYANWFLRFRKDEVTGPLTLSDDEEIELVGGLKYAVTGGFGEEGEDALYELVMGSGRRLEISEGLFDFLRLVERPRVLRKVLADFREIYVEFDQDDKALLVAQLLKLREKGFLTIRPSQASK